MGERTRKTDDARHFTFHHAKLTAAIASCLAAFPQNEFSTDELLKLRDKLKGFDEPDFLERLKGDEMASQKALCLLVRGDIAGIQRWLYRIARPETGKRLRGRSFYLVLLTEAIAEWLCRQAQMPPCNILFCGGGVFDVLLPATKNVVENLPQWEKQLDGWLLQEFYGELRVNFASVLVTAVDFYDCERLYRRLATELGRAKAKQLKGLLSDPNFLWFERLQNLCPFCQSIPLQERQEQCDQCRLQERLGHLLRMPEAQWLVWTTDTGQLEAREDMAFVPFRALGRSVSLATTEAAVWIVRKWDGKGEISVRKRNDPKDWWKPLDWEKKKRVEAGI